MWPNTFAERLVAWNQLRQQAALADLETALGMINSWWFRSPWTPYHLHWDDWQEWPDPWQLLDDNVYCSVARGLGILYTVSLLERKDLQDCVLIESAADNLVLVPGEKYILNWDPKQIVNITPGPFNYRRSLSQGDLAKNIR